MNELKDTKWMHVQGGEAEDLPSGDDWRGGVQVRDHIPRHVHLSSLLLVNNFITRCVTFQINLTHKRFVFCTAKTQYRKFETSIFRKGIARPQSQFPHSCFCERFITSHKRSVYSAAGKYVDRSWEYINRSQIHECGNWDWSRAIPVLGIGIHKWDFRCSAVITLNAEKPAFQWHQYYHGFF